MASHKKITEVLFGIEIMALLFLSYSCDKVQYVDTCPSNEQSWDQRSKIFPCDAPHEKYHCLQTIENTLIETCMVVHNIPFYKNGCPWVKIRNGRAYLRNPFKPCNSTRPGCPEKHHRKYQTNKLYNYPVCISPGITNTSDSVTERTTVTAVIQDENDGGSTILIILFSSIIPVVSICVVLYICLGRKNSHRRCTKDQNEIPNQEEIIPDSTVETGQESADIKLESMEVSNKDKIPKLPLTTEDNLPQSANYGFHESMKSHIPGTPQATRLTEKQRQSNSPLLLSDEDIATFALIKRSHGRPRYTSKSKRSDISLDLEQAFLSIHPLDDRNMNSRDSRNFDIEEEISERV